MTKAILKRCTPVIPRCLWYASLSIDECVYVSEEKGQGEHFEDRTGLSIMSVNTKPEWLNKTA